MIPKYLSATLACLSGLLILATSHPASAAHPCPSGPGPGERIVGQSPGGRGTAPVLLCERAAEGAASSAPSTSGPSYAAMAWHPDVEDVWATARMNSQGWAESQALEACNQAMGGGCEVVGYSSGTMIVSVARTGLLALATASSKRKARKEMHEFCEQMNLFCTEIAVLQSGDTYPSFSREAVVNLREPASTARKRYGALAWPSAPGDGRAWVSTGHDSEDQAKEAAESACRQALAADADADADVECKITTSSGNGILVTYVSDDDDMASTAARSEEQAHDIIAAVCKKHELKNCVVDTIYPVKRPGTFLHTFRTRDK